MTKVIYVCDKCKSEFTVVNSLYNVNIVNQYVHVSDHFDICNSCFKDLIKLIRSDAYVITSDDLQNMERSNYEEE